MLQPNMTWPILSSALKELVQAHASDLTLPGIIFIGLAAIRGIWLRKTRPITWLMSGIGISYVLFSSFFHNAVFVQATLMGTFITICILLGVGLGSLKPSWQNVGGVLCLGWAAVLALKNWPFVTSLTRDQTGVAYTATVEKLEAPAGSVVMAPWGRSYFALAYAQRVEG